MVEKTALENAEERKERFEFVFSVNGNIICQRYFKINGFKESSLGSTILADAVEECVNIINKDLREKTRIYLHYTSPQVFSNKEEMERKLADSSFELESPSFIVFNDSDETYVWKGTKAVLYDKKFNKDDYAKGDKEEFPCIFKFAFLDNGEEVRSISWDGGIYPKFVRMNIDLSNTRNKFKTDSFFEPYGAAIIDIFNASQKDIIPVIMKELCVACSKDNPKKYTSLIEYGEKSYDLDIKRRNAEYEKKVEAECKKRTAAYFSETL